MRELVKQAVRRVGLEAPARMALDALDARRPARRRDRTDNDHLRLLLAFMLDADTNCVDIGANRGLVLDNIIRYAPAGRHVAFEPLPELAADLARRYPSVRVEQVALSNETGIARFAHVEDANVLSGLSDRGLGEEGHRVNLIEVPVTKLDDALPPDYRPGFMKIDVEGAEYQLLLGAERILSEVHPPIWLEHGGDASAHFGATSAEVWELLCTEHGYRIMDADGVGPLSRPQFEACLGRVWNFLAR